MERVRDTKFKMVNTGNGFSAGRGRGSRGDRRQQKEMQRGMERKGSVVGGEQSPELGKGNRIP